MCTANGCLTEGCGPGMPGPYQGNENRDTGPCGSVSLLLMRFYAFLKPTLCMNLTKAA